MNKRIRKKDEKQIEKFLLDIADAFDAATREYWEEREAENRLYVREYVRRTGLVPKL